MMQTVRRKNNSLYIYIYIFSQRQLIQKWNQRTDLISCWVIIDCRWLDYVISLFLSVTVFVCIFIFIFFSFDYGLNAKSRNSAWTVGLTNQIQRASYLIWGINMIHEMDDMWSYFILGLEKYMYYFNRRRSLVPSNIN